MQSQSCRYAKFASEYAAELLFCGFCDSRAEYAAWLRRCHVFVSTANHETFGASLIVRVAGRSISPQWRLIRVRLAPRTYAPWGVRVVCLTKLRKIPTRKMLPLFLGEQECSACGVLPLVPQRNYYTPLAVRS